jgi:hypothetical protein
MAREAERDLTRLSVGMNRAPAPLSRQDAADIASGAKEFHI